MLQPTIIPPSVALSGEAPQQFIVYINNPDCCGSGGCTMLVLDPHGDHARGIEFVPLQ
jgi:hypothetical protein